jgi:tetratricopeptide (TPR) repeat protein
MTRTATPIERSTLGDTARSSSIRSVEDVLSSVRVDPTEIHGFVRLWDSLDWQLARQYWKRVGLLGFVRGDVPFLVNNSGRLSEHAAAILFDACLQGNHPKAPIVVLELGAGTGLFARYFLDAFKAICTEQGRTFYDDLLFLVTDESLRTVEQWQERGLFAEHAAHVALCTCDARRPESLQCIAPSPRFAADAVRLAAIFCNYLLDVLPMTIVRKRGAAIEEPHVRSVFCEERPAAAAAGWSVERVRELLASERDEEGDALLALLGAFDVEVDYRPVAGPVAALATEAFARAPESERLVLNDGALEALEAWLPRLASCGWALLNDYATDLTHACTPQHFGPSLACGVNFAWLDRALEARGYVVEAAEQDVERAIRTRLVTATERGAPARAFRNRFSRDAELHLDEPLYLAHSHVTQGRKNDALDAYRAALDRNPRDFRLLGEIAEFVGLELGDSASGSELAQGAIQRNPWLSPWLWNILGDCSFAQKQFDHAHASYLAARAIDPDDPRTNLNLAYTFTERAEFAEALNVIARGLAHDARGHFRARLLDKQAQVLAALTGRRTLEQHRMETRLARLR